LPSHCLAAVSPSLSSRRLRLAVSLSDQVLLAEDKVSPEEHEQQFGIHLIKYYLQKKVLKMH
jgi:hypothetical protein